MKLNQINGQVYYIDAPATGTLAGPEKLFSYGS